MFLSDQPIETPDQDKLGRNKFAESLAKAILSYEQTDSIVVGLYGEWGNGKSSLLKLVQHYLLESLNIEYKNKKPIIINFNPWNFSDQNQLITLFFNLLSQQLARKDNSTTLK